MAEKRPRGRPRAFNDTGTGNIIQSLDRAMAVLADLAENGGVTLSELAARTDQSPATLYRVLSTLQKHEMTELEEETQTWHVGTGAFRIGSVFLRRTSVAERARPVMRELMRATGETANLGIESGDEVLFVSQIETHASIRAFFPPGTRSPMHASGIGKALLAFSPADRLTGILARQPLERFTPATLTQPEGLRENLALIRERGFSVDDEERTEGMRCIAAPIFNAYGEPVAGLSVSGPASRMPLSKAADIGGIVRAAADRVTHAIGARALDRAEAAE